MIRKTIVIVPLYRGAHLIEGLFHSIVGAAADFASIDGHLLLINDSPDDVELAATLSRRLPELEAKIPVELLRNEANMGFVRTSNRGFEIARTRKADVILLNSDTVVVPGALAEMRSVAYSDPLIGFVSPRSDNATLCNSPAAERFRRPGLATALEAHKQIERFLPALTYVPTAVGFCLFIKHTILVEFGGFDEIFGAGYNEENDLIQRCNRYGYRAALANHAFVHHIGGASFGATGTASVLRDQENLKILLKRHPAYLKHTGRYWRGAEYQAQYALSGLAAEPDGRRRILFECSNLGPFYNGTFDLSKKLIAEFAARYSAEFECWIACSEPAYRFHDFDRIVGLRYTGADTSDSGPYMAAIRVGQPFSINDIVKLGQSAPICAFTMLDTIAMDCQEIDDVGLNALWQRMMNTMSMVGYISEFSRAEFRRRFAVRADMVEFTVMPSTDVASYMSPSPSRSKHGGGYVLIVGNHFHHKFVRETVAAFLDRPQKVKLVVLGVEMPRVENVESFRSGELDETVVDRLYSNADVFLFPSHNEGFGLPVMHALARKKVIVARKLPVFDEIARQSQFGENIHTFDTTAEMIDFVLSKPRWRDDARSVDKIHGWGDAAAELRAAIQRAEATLSYSNLVGRMRQILDLIDLIAPQQQLRVMARVRKRTEKIAGRRAMGFLRRMNWWPPHTPSPKG